MSFRIMVHRFGGNGPSTRPIVTVYCGGVRAARFGEAPDEVLMTTSGSNCGGHSWRVADLMTTIDPDTGVLVCDVNPLSTASGGNLLLLNNRNW